MNKDEDKTKFLTQELFILSINGAFQHNLLYNKEKSDKDKKRFRDNLETELKNIAKDYSKEEVSEEEHINRLIKFSERNESLLNGGKFRFGTAQKLLNLYLKYLWCWGEIKIPPHCPFDGIILGKHLGLKDSWTKSNKTEDYLAWVNAAKEKAGKLKIAEWELKVFQRK